MKRRASFSLEVDLPQGGRTAAWGISMAPGRPAPKRGAIGTRSSASRNRGAIICRLSDDLVLHVFSFLEARVLWLMLQVNRRFNRVSSEDLLWHALLSSEVGQANLPRFIGAQGTWRRRFLQWQRLDSCGCEEQVPSLVDGGSSPQARFLHRAACLSDRWLYVFGGQGQEGEFNDLWVLDKERALSSGGWQNLHPVGIAPEQRQSATLTTVGTRLLMFGGRQGETTFMNDTWLFDTATCRWTCVYESEESPVMVQAAGSVGQRPCPRWAHSAVRFGGRILVFGGSAAWSKCPRSAPAPPQGAPGDSGQLDTHRQRPAHWAPSHCLGGLNWPPPKPPMLPPLTLQAARRGAASTTSTGSTYPQCAGCRSTARPSRPRSAAATARAPWTRPCISSAATRPSPPSTTCGSSTCRVSPGGRSRRQARRPGAQAWHRPRERRTGHESAALPAGRLGRPWAGWYSSQRPCHQARPKPRLLLPPRQVAVRARRAHHHGAGCAAARAGRPRVRDQLLRLPPALLRRAHAPLEPGAAAHLVAAGRAAAAEDRPLHHRPCRPAPALRRVARGRPLP